MGQAKRRGTFEQRQAQAKVMKFSKEQVARIVELERRIGMTPEELEAESRDRGRALRFLAAGAALASLPEIPPTPKNRFGGRRHAR